MQKLREVHLVSNGGDMEEVLSEAGAFSEQMNLRKKDALRVRLLAEETLSMLQTLTGEVELSISFIEKEGACIIRLETDTRMDAFKRDQILSLSSSGKNASAKGIMGKVRDVFETVFTMPPGEVWVDYCPASMQMGLPGSAYEGQLMDVVYWSLSSYRENTKNSEGDSDYQGKWDELEKSIVSNIADDVQVGVKGRHVVMDIIYKLEVH